VTLPYKKTIKIIGNTDKGSTNFQKLKFAEAKVQNNLLLKAERDEYLNRLLNDRLEKEEIKTRKEQFGFYEEKKRESIREELRKVEFQNEIRALESGFKNLLS
jgi:hypothetical protein